MKSIDYLQIRLVSLLMFAGVASLLFIQASMAARQSTEGAAMPGKGTTREEILAQERKLTTYGIEPYRDALAEFILSFDNLEIVSHNLEPGGVYSVRVARENEYRPLNSGDEEKNTFTAVEEGPTTFTTQISRIELRSWDWIEVVQHLDGDPQNMDRDNLDTVFEVATDELIWP